LLQITVDQLDDLLTATEEDPDPLHRREFAGLATGLALAPLLRPRNGGRIGEPEVRQLLHRTARLRRLDDHLGGMDTYIVYLSEMKATTKLAKNASYSSATSRAVMGVVAEQAQMAGWAAFDAGRYADARRHYMTALAAAEQSQDPALIGNSLAFMAYEKADIETAAASCRVAGAETSPKVRALLHERLAWTHAIAGDADQTDRALAKATDAVQAPGVEPEPDWVYWVDGVEIQIMSGRCWTELQRPDRAVPILEAALPHYDDTHSRDKALYLTWLAHAYLDAGEVEQSAAVADHAIDLSTGVGSVRPGQRIATVMRRLNPHRRLPVVAAVLDHARG
jgi:tetratricopeptide (TPR) repeat protein